MTQKIGRVLGVSVALLAVMAAVLVLLPSGRSEAQPLPPNRFFGTARLDGQPGAGASIVALVGTTSCGTSTADSSGNYRLDVLSSGERPSCGTDGATVNFTVSGARATQTGTWRQGEFTQLDLTATRAPAATATVAPPAATVAPPTGATVAPPAATVAPPAATVRLPVTGTGGGDAAGSWMLLALAGLAVVGAGSVLAVRRMRS